MTSPARSRKGSGKFLGLAFGLVAVAGLVAAGRSQLFGGSGQTGERPLTAKVRKATLRVLVTERGNLESKVTVDGVCELSGHQNKIIQLIAEGTRVEKGQVVCRFDSSEIDKNIAQQQIKAKQAKTKIETSEQELEIARNEALSEEIKAQGELKVARLTQELYLEGTNPADKLEAQSKISLASKEFEKTKDELEQMKGLVKKGFRSPQQLRALENSLEQFKFQKSSEERRYQVKSQFEFKKTEYENQSKVELSEMALNKAKASGKAKVAKAQSEVEAARGTFQIENQQLEEFQKQKEKTVLKADGAGILAYANDRFWDASSQIREGATVYSRQKIFSIPDLTQMQVKVNIHESMIKKIKIGQTAELRVDAFPNLALKGVVKTVSNLADSNRGWLNGGVKEYPTTVDVTNTPTDSSLKPGMTAEVQILIQELRDVLQVPVQAVADRKGSFYAFVETPTGFDPRPVKIGESDDKFVEVLEGLNVDEIVALDARSRAAVVFKDDATRPEDDKSRAAAPPSTGAGKALP